jgi:hypothetical protein
MSVTSARLRMRTKLLYGVSAIAISVALASAALLAMDVYLHSHVPNVVNIWGYRGPIAGRKRPGEIRVVVLGGSTAYGYGLPWQEAFPNYLEQMLNERAGRSTYRVINLGAPAQGALGFKFDLADYAYLDYDVAIFYEGYNDLGRDDLPEAVPPRTGPNNLLWRRQSPIFRFTGYFPVLPIVFREKAMLMMAGGDLDGAYRGRVVFRPNLATRATAGAIASAAKISESIGSAIGHVAGDPAYAAKSTPLDVETWRHYTDRVIEAVRLARARSVRAIVVTQPYASNSHMAQQRALAHALDDAFRGDGGVRYVNLGLAVDIRDRSIAYDGLHLVAVGNRRIASLLVDPVLGMTSPS